MCSNEMHYRGIVAIVWLLCAAAAVQAAQFHVAVGDDAKAPGTKITIPIVATADVTVGAAQLEVLYDPQRLRWVGGDAGKLTANTLLDANLVDRGRIRIAFAGGEDVNGSGTIYQAAFEWTGSQSGPTNIAFAGVRAWDQATGLELATSASPGEAVPASVAAVPPGTTQQTPAPPAAATNYLLYVAIGILAVLLVATVVLLLRKNARPSNPQGATR